MGIYPKEMKTLIQKDICTPIFTAALFTIIVKTWNNAHSEIFFSYKKKEISKCATTLMKFEVILLSEISQTMKDKYCMILLMSGIKKKNS